MASTNASNISTLLTSTPTDTYIKSSVQSDNMVVDAIMKEPVGNIISELSQSSLIASNTEKKNLYSNIKAYNSRLEVSESSDNTINSFLISEYNTVKDLIKNLETKYSEIVSAKKAIESGLTVSAMFQLYNISLHTEAEAYAKLAKLISEYNSDNSALIICVERIRALISQYYNLDSSEDDFVSNGQSIIRAIITESAILSAEIERIIENTSLMDSSIEIDPHTTTDDGLLTLKNTGNNSRSFECAPSSSEFNIFKMDIKRTDLIGQNSTLYLRAASNGSDITNVYITDAMYTMYDAAFTRQNISYFLGLVNHNHYDYINAYEEDNDGSDPDNKNDTVTKYRRLRIGNIFTGDGSFTNEDASAKFKPSEDATWSKGKLIKEITNFKFNKFRLDGKFSNGQQSIKEYAYNSHFSDSVKLNYSVSCRKDDTDYTVGISGELSYDKTLTNENGNGSYYTGTLTVECDDLGSSVSKQVVCSIVANSWIAYDVLVYIDPDGLSSSSVSTGNTLDDLSPIFITRSFRSNISTDVNCDDDPSLKSIQALYTMLYWTKELKSDSDAESSELNSTFVSFTNAFSNAYDIFYDSVNNIDDSLSENLTLISDIATNILVSESIFTSNDSNYNSDIMTDMTTIISTITSDITTWTTEDSDTKLYDSTIYTEILELVGSLDSAIAEFVSSSASQLKTLSDLENMLITIGCSSKLDISIANSLVIFSSVLNKEADMVKTTEVSGSYYPGYPVDDYAEWSAYYTEKIANNLKTNSEYKEKLYLYSTISMAMKQYSFDDCFIASYDIWRSLLCSVLLELSEAYGLNTTMNFNFSNDVFNSGKIISSASIFKSKIGYFEVTGREFSSNPNYFNINPVFYSIDSNMENFNFIDLDEFFSLSAFSSEETGYLPFLNKWKTIVYASLLKHSEDEISDYLKFIHKVTINDDNTLNSLNIREIVALTCIIMVLDELKENPETKNIATEYAFPNYEYMKNILFSYRELYYLYSNSEIALDMIADTTTFKQLIVNGIPD